MECYSNLCHDVAQRAKVGSFKITPLLPNSHLTKCYNNLSQTNGWSKQSKAPSALTVNLPRITMRHRIKHSIGGELMATLWLVVFENKIKPSSNPPEIFSRNLANLYQSENDAADDNALIRKAQLLSLVCARKWKIILKVVWFFLGFDLLNNFFKYSKLFHQ